MREGRGTVVVSHPYLGLPGVSRGTR